MHGRHDAAAGGLPAAAGAQPGGGGAGGAGAPSGATLLCWDWSWNWSWMLIGLWLLVHGEQACQPSDPTHPPSPPAPPRPPCTGAALQDRQHAGAHRLPALHRPGPGPGGGLHPPLPPALLPQRGGQPGAQVALPGRLHPHACARCGHSLLIPWLLQPVADKQVGCVWVWWWWWGGVGGGGGEWWRGGRGRQQCGEGGRCGSSTAGLPAQSLLRRRHASEAVAKQLPTHSAACPLLPPSPRRPCRVVPRHRYFLQAHAARHPHRSSKAVEVPFPMSHLKCSDLQFAKHCGTPLEEYEAYKAALFPGESGGESSSSSSSSDADAPPSPPPPARP